jgi:ABC-type glutathione transport system ATPase component
MSRPPVAVDSQWQEQRAISMDRRPDLTPVAPHESLSGEAIHPQALQRDFDGVRAVDGVDLRIPAGEIHGFLGPNGSGNTATVKMLQNRRRIGVALQDAALAGFVALRGRIKSGPAER